MRERHSLIINWLLYLGITIHEHCIENFVGRPVTRRLAVPSLRPGSTHPFVRLAQQTKAVSEAVSLQPVAGAVSDHRTISAQKFTLEPGVDLTGHHIMILDDTWTTGANAQSAALTVREAGAAAISVIVAGRWLNPEWSAPWQGAGESPAPPYRDNSEFIRTRVLRRDYNPYICPVTGGACP